MKKLNRIMSLMVLLLALTCVPLLAQDMTFPTQPINSIILGATATTATSSWVDLSQPNWRDARFFTLTFYSFGTVTTCQIKAQQSPDKSSTSDLIANQTCTSSDTTTTSAEIAAGTNYVRINLGTKTGSGTTLGVLSGWRQDPYGTADVTVNGAITCTGCATATNQTDGSQKTQVYYGGTTTPILPSDVAPVNSATAPVSTLNSSSMGSGLGAALGCNFDDTAPTSLTENNFGYARCSTLRQLYVLAQATAVNGTTGCAIVSAASTNSTSCATAAAGFYGFDIWNTTTTIYYLRLYNSSGAPTCSSATGFVRSIPLAPAPSAGLLGGNILSLTIPNTGDFGNGLGYCITGGSSSTDNTNAAVGILGSLRYKQ